MARERKKEEPRDPEEPYISEEDRRLLRETIEKLTKKSRQEEDEHVRFLNKNPDKGR